MSTISNHKRNKITLSISIVNFNSEKYLLNCLKSLIRFKPPRKFEILIFDNSPKINTYHELSKLGLTLNYYKSDRNAGFGLGHNHNVEYAKGEYLLILNPDTEFIEKNFWQILKIVEDTNSTIVGPKIIKTNGEEEQTFSKMPDPIKGLVYYSILGKYFPGNLLSENFWMKNKARSNEKIEVGIVSGAALFIQKKTFINLNGFDPKIFLYFEDTDLCFRAKKAGIKIIYYPKAILKHAGGGSMPSKNYYYQQLIKGRFYFFRKNHSLISAILLEACLRPLEWLSHLKKQSTDAETSSV